MNNNINVDELKRLIMAKPIDWRDIFDKYVVYWKWILASVIIVLVAGLAYYRSQPNQYVFKSTLLIAENSSGQMNQMSIIKQLDVFGMSTSSSNIYNERQVIHSKELIKKVVDELKLHTTYSMVSFLKPVELYTDSPLEVALSADALMQLKGKLKISVDKGSNGTYQVAGKHILGTFQSTSFSYKLNELPATIETPAGMLSIMLKNPAYDWENAINILIQEPIQVVNAYREGALSTEVPKDGDLVVITLQEKHVQKGQDFLERLIYLYNQDAIDQINKSANFTAMFIDGRLTLLTDELTDVEQELQTYKQTNKLTNIETDAELFLQRSSLYDQQRNEHEIQLQLIQYIEEFLKDAVNQYALIPNLGLTDVGLISVIQEYNKLLLSRERYVSGSSATNPALISLESQIKSGRMSIQNSIGISRKGIQIGLRELDSQHAFLASQLKKIPQQEREFLEIKRQQEIKATLYMFLLQKREEASLSMAVTIPKARLLDAADTAEKTAPKLPMTLAVSLLLGLLMPVGFLYLKFMLTTTFESRKELESLTKVPVIAELANQKKDDVIIDHGTNANANAELLRLLRSKLQFILNKPKERVVVVTSTESGEGKTFVSMNLAVSISLTGKKVLLVGMDLRKPMLGIHFGINSHDGISSYLSGLETDYNKLIHHNKEFPNLWVMPGGIIPPNPNELILSDNLDTLFNKLKEEYDYIIVDSAPVGAVSDTLLVNRISNLTLYVCRANYTDKRNLEFVERIQQEKLLNQIYLVVNDVDADKGARYGYGYGYGKRKANS